MGTSIKSSKTVAICFHHVFKRHCREYLQQIKGRFHLVCQEGGSGSEESLTCWDVSFAFEAVCRCRHQQRWTCQQGLLLQADRCCSYFAKSLWLCSCFLSCTKQKQRRMLLDRRCLTRWISRQLVSSPLMNG